jgi:hypothetical protein
LFLQDTESSADVPRPRLGRNAAGGSVLRWTTAYWVVILTLACSPAAFGYADPGSGALLWQILAASFIGAGFYFRRFLNWIRRIRGGKQGAPDVR